MWTVQTLGMKMSVAIAIIFSLSVCGPAHKVSGAPLQDLVQKLPQQPDVGFKQYAGYVTVNATATRALFYYFVEAETNATTKPITLWLGRAPQCSSIATGGFQGVGPFYANKEGLSLIKNNYSWNKVSNVLFVDSPAGVGWSYSNTTSDYVTDDDKIAADNMNFIFEWFSQKFPEYINNEFYIAGEAYGGHSVPQLANLVLDSNTVNSKNITLNFKGIIVGNPFLDLFQDRVRGVIENVWSHGMISEATYQLVASACFSNFSLPISSACLSAYGQAIINESQIYENPQIDPYDMTADTCPNDTSLLSQKFSLSNGDLGFSEINHGSLNGFGPASSNEDPCAFAHNLTLYLNQPAVQEALHVSTTDLRVPYAICTNKNSRKVNFTFEVIRPIPSMIPILSKISSAGMRIFIYSGDQDSVFPFPGTRRQIADMADTQSWTPSLYQPWYEGGQIGGWRQTYGPNNGLTFATVKGASQRVPWSRPLRALKLFESFINAQGLPTSVADSY